MNVKALAALAFLLAGPLIAADPVAAPTALWEKIRPLEGATLVAALLAAEDETVVLFSRRIADTLQKLRDSEQRLSEALDASQLSARRRKTLEASLAECVGHRRELSTALESVATARKQQLRPRD
jgi:hypothetical protein